MYTPEQNELKEAMDNINKPKCRIGGCNENSRAFNDRLCYAHTPKTTPDNGIHSRLPRMTMDVPDEPILSKCCGAELCYGKPTGLSTYNGLYCSNCRDHFIPQSTEKECEHPSYDRKIDCDYCRKKRPIEESILQDKANLEKCKCKCKCKNCLDIREKDRCSGDCNECPPESSWMEEEREAWDETSKCYDIAGSVRPIVTDYWLTRMAEQIKAETKRCLAAHSSQIPFIFQKGQKIGVEQGRTEERERVISEIQSVKKRFLCGACNGAKCEHTLGCKALNELLDKLK